jgi:co-chaperonin GroES (HSP10)
MKFIPFNKWIVMKPVEDTGRHGILYLAPTAAKQYQRAVIVALPDIPEVSKWKVGSTVFYDMIGEVRVGRGDDTVVLVSYLNVLGQIEEETT